MCSEFLAILFEYGESACFSASPKGTRVSPVVNPHPPTAEFVSVNPLFGDIDLGDKAIPGNGRRADINVSAHRNFLLEIDRLPIEEQRAYIDSLAVPWSTQTYSGGKSYHFVIALESPVSAEEYRHYSRWLLNIVLHADPSVKNPSRFTRLAGATRKDTGKQQAFIEGRGRISLESFKNWLSLRPDCEPKRVDPDSHYSLNEVTPDVRGLLWPTTYQFLREGAPEGFRNRYLFMAACDFHEQNYPIEEALTRLAKASTLSGTEFAETVKSAYARPPKYGVRTWGLRFVQKVS